MSSPCVFTTLGKASGDDAVELSPVDEGTTTGPWPMWWAAAKGLSRADELTAGKVSLFFVEVIEDSEVVAATSSDCPVLAGASDVDSGIASAKAGSEIAKQSDTKDFIVMSRQRKTKSLRRREVPKHQSDRKLLISIIKERKSTDQKIVHETSAHRNYDTLGVDQCLSLLRDYPYSAVTQIDS